MYTDNDLNTRIEPKNQNISKVQVLIMILHEREQKKYSRGFCWVPEKLHQFYSDQGNSMKKLDGDGNESRDNKKKGKRGTQSIKNDKLQIIHKYNMLEYFYLAVGGMVRISTAKNKGKQPWYSQVSYPCM